MEERGSLLHLKARACKHLEQNKHRDESLSGFLEQLEYEVTGRDVSFHTLHLENVPPGYAESLQRPRARAQGCPPAIG